MNYNYEQCFWDPHDDGVNILLEHIASGIKSCETMLNFFKQRSELEKDYARRLGAIGHKLSKDMETKSEFGNVYKTYNLILRNEKSRAQAHSKQSEVINRQIYSDIKIFSQNLQAKYVTISSKAEKLRMDKYNKKKGCEELSKRLEEAQTLARDLQLNQNNIIGSRKVEQNKKELAKWESNTQEITLQLDVLKQELKASQKFWFKEWATMTQELQEMETARISFLQSKIQQYTQTTIETCLVEQARMDGLTNQLIAFTAADDIRDFSSNFGTGRLKEKRQSNNNRCSMPDTREQSVNSQSYKSDSYVENIRKLSAQLQKQAPKPERTYIDNELEMSFKPNDTQDSRLTNDQQKQSYIETREPPAQKNTYKLTMRDMRIIEETRPNKNYEEVTRYTPPRLQAETSPDNQKTYSSSSADSSQPTDFTTHVNNRTSIDSMGTSVSSMASSIDDSQRFVKSWNSSNRKRKSMSHIHQQLQEPEIQQNSPTLPSPKNDLLNVRDNLRMRESSASTMIINRRHSGDYHVRRKSLVLKDSQNPIEDALYEMERMKSIGSGGIFASSDIMVGRVRDDGVTVTLPTVTTDGEPVIKYAKAVYPLCNNDAPEVAHFQKGDYLLITALINDDWFKGEVYENESIIKDHRSGLIPFNFIKLLS